MKRNQTTTATTVCLFVSVAVRRADLAKAALFRKMLDDNAAQFLDVFVEAPTGTLLTREEFREKGSVQELSSERLLAILLKTGAHSIMVAHNHPSGDPTPSEKDVRLTKKLVTASQIMGIPLYDHLVLGTLDSAGGKGFVSLRQSRLVDFAD